MKIMLDQSDLNQALQDYIFKKVGDTSYIDHYKMIWGSNGVVKIDEVEIVLK